MKSSAKKKPASTPSKNDRRLLIFSIAVFVVVCIFAAKTFLPRVLPTSELPQSTGQPMPASSAINANLTAMPNSAPLSGPLAEQVGQIQTMMDACPDYSTERRSQMQQHIDWMLNPATIPNDMIIALGDNPNGNLIRGMATYTLSDWGLKNQAADSCLLSIGKQLNTMLVAQGLPLLESFEK